MHNYLLRSWNVLPTPWTVYLFEVCTHGFRGRDWHRQHLWCHFNVPREVNATSFCSMVFIANQKLQYLDITKVVYTDASMHGCGAYCDGMSTGGSRINAEKNWLAYKCSQIKIHSFKSHVNCQGSWDLCKVFFR